MKALSGPAPGTTAPNPNPPSSPIFSSVLAVHFSAHVENTTEGFTLSPADHQALADGDLVRLSNGTGDKITVELIADFPNFIPNPLPFFSGNIRLSNPFDLVVVGDQVYVTDGGRNLVWQVDIATGEFSNSGVLPNDPEPIAPSRSAGRRRRSRPESAISTVSFWWRSSGELPFRRGPHRFRRSTRRQARRLRS